MMTGGSDIPGRKPYTASEISETLFKLLVNSWKIFLFARKLTYATLLQLIVLKLTAACIYKQVKLIFSNIYTMVSRILFSQKRCKPILSFILIVRP